MSPRLYLRQWIMTIIARNPALLSNLEGLLSDVEWTIKPILKIPTPDSERTGVIRLYRVSGRRHVFPERVAHCIITARHPHSQQQLLGDLSMSRQSTSASANYPQAGSMSHAAYDPVHDPYNVPRMPSTSQSGQIDPYGAAAFPRDDRAPPPQYGYGAATRDDVHFRPAGLTRLDDTRRERLQYTPSHELESLSYRAPTHPASQAMHSFRIQAATPGNEQHPVYSGAVPETPSTYPSLPPLTVPGAQQTDDRAGSRRIVMACHQW